MVRSTCPIASIPGMAERTIIASGASKTYSWTGGRIGWGVFPTVVEAKVQRRLNINYFASIPPYNQLGVKVALESPESAPAIALMVEAFQRRRDLVVGAPTPSRALRARTRVVRSMSFPTSPGCSRVSMASTSSKRCQPR